MGRFAEAMGTPLLPWQQYVVDVALEVDEVGDWVYDQVVLTVPRQSGKTFLIGPLIAQRCVERSTTAWFTAQSRENAEELWEGSILAQLQESPKIKRQFTATIGVGNKKVVWPAHRSVLRPFGPKPKKMHGKSPDLVWVDEIWTFPMELASGLRQSYRPAWSMKSGQEWLSSTAGTADGSEWLNYLRRQGRADVEAGRRQGRAFFEWSAPEQLDGVEVWDLPDELLVPLVLDYHPRRDHGLRAQYVRGELEDPGPDRTRRQVVRDYSNVTEPSVGSSGLFAPAVMEQSHRGGNPDGRIALGVAVDDLDRESTICVAWRDADGVAWSSYQCAEGSVWLAGEVLRLKSRYDVGTVAVQSASPTRDVADELERVGIEVLRLSQADMAAAGSRFFREFGAGRVMWDDGEKSVFAPAVARTEKGQVNSGIVWHSVSGAPITPVPAGTLAVWGVDHMPEVEGPEPEFRIW